MTDLRVVVVAALFGLLLGVGSDHPERRGPSLWAFAFALGAGLVTWMTISDDPDGSGALAAVSLIVGGAACFVGVALSRLTRSR